MGTLTSHKKEKRDNKKLNDSNRNSNKRQYGAIRFVKITAQWNTTRVYLRKSFRRLLVCIQRYRYSNIHLRNLNISFHSLPDLAPHTRQYLRKEDQARNAH